MNKTKIKQNRFNSNKEKVVQICKVLLKLLLYFVLIKYLKQIYFVYWLHLQFF